MRLDKEKNYLEKEIKFFKKKLDGLTQPVNILAYTKSEWEDLVAKISSFTREINEKGVLCA